MKIEPLIEPLVIHQNLKLGIQIKFLKECPELIPTLAQWIYEEWKPYDISLTKGKLINRLSGRLNNDKIPLAIVALRNEIPIGTVSLKEQNEPKFTEISKGDPWLGSLEVIKEERNKGIGQELLEKAKALAINLGYKGLFLYTSNSINLDWYHKRGACYIETCSFRNHTITIMKIDL